MFGEGLGQIRKGQGHPHSPQLPRPRTQPRRRTENQLNDFADALGAAGAPLLPRSSWRRSNHGSGEFVSGLDSRNFRSDFKSVEAFSSAEVPSALANSTMIRIIM